MRYNPTIEHSEVGLNVLLNTIQIFEKDAVLSGVLECKMDMNEVTKLILYVREKHCILLRERKVLEEFAETFNDQFATDHNNCFSTAERLFRQMKKTLQGTTKVYLKFCKKINRHIPGKYSVKVSALDYSCIGNRSYTRFFESMGVDWVDGPVKELCDILELFFFDLRKSIVLCMGVMRDERILKQSPERLDRIYRKCCESMISSQQFAIGLLKERGIEIEEDKMSIYIRQNPYEDFLKTWFHAINIKEFDHHRYYQLQQKAKQLGYEPIEIQLWGYDEKIPVYRYIIDHFDELDPKGNKVKNSDQYGLSSQKLGWFVEWCKPSVVGIFINEYLKNRYHGQYHIPAENTVSTARGKKENETLKLKHEAFNSELDAMKQRYLNSRQTKEAV